MCRRSAGLNEYRGLLRFRARPITPCGGALPQEASSGCGRVRMSMNETVYLFALSVPDLLEALVNDQAARSREARQPEPEEQPS